GFDQDLSSWDISNLSDAQDMFASAGLSVENYDVLLIGWSTDSSGTAGDGIDDVPSNLTFDGGNSQFCVGEFERSVLDTSFNWNITDGGRSCPDPSTHFVTTWDTGSTFNPVKSVITIPTTGGGYNYDVDWDNDGVFDQFGITGGTSFDYGVEGIYTIRIQGSFPRIYCEGNPDQGTKLESVDQWGAIKWQSFEGAFTDTSELAILAPDVPDLSEVTSMARAFMNALAQFNPTFLNANSWDMSTITDMSSMFEDSGFSSPINNWDVSNVTDMDRMFLDADQFNQDIGAWNVSSVMDMRSMFFDTTNFNQDIGGWDVSSVTTMRDMFDEAAAFDQNLENWDIGSLNASGAINMFDGVTLSTANYDALLIGWSTDSSGVSGDGIDDVTSNLTFDGGNSQYCVGEFERNQLDTNFNWNISDGGRFCPDPSTHFVTTWDTGSTFSPIKSVITILTTGGGYNYDVDWDNDGVFDQFGITGEVSFDYGVEGIYTIRIQGSFPRLYCEGNADQGTKLESVDQWGAIKWQSFEGAFKDTSELAILAPDVPDLSQVTSMARAFQNALAQFDPTFLNANSWDMSTITDMSSMFEDSGFNSPINNWDVSNVTDMDRMFLDAEQFNQNIGAWNVSAVMDMNEMFRETIDFNQNIGGWDVSNVTTMRGMFEDADAFDQNLENWDIGSLNSNGAFRMFRDITLSTVNYDALLIGWSTDSSGIPGDGIDDVPSNLTFGGGNSQYCFGETARNLLTDTAGLNWSIADGGLNCGVTLRPKVFLQGASINPILGEENLLRDDLRSNGFIPTTSPYSDAKTVESSVFTATGSDALVDWVWVELRSPINNRFIIDSQSALLQRDGDIVDVDGSSALRFFQDTGNYHIAIKHRNHLGIMSASSIALNTTDVLVDFTDGSTVAFGSNAQTNFGMPTGILGMWAGNVNGDSIVQYSGTNPDTPSILSTVLNDPGNFLNFPTFSITAYNANDVNMNSVIQYSGTSPDTPFIIQNVLAHPGNFLNFSTYQIIEQLPENL
ncbi:MAG: BspA family leucine-rich repeat surface protein, partial [Bacteroidota bacterium]